MKIEDHDLVIMLGDFKFSVDMDYNKVKMIIFIYI